MRRRLWSAVKWASLLLVIASLTVAILLIRQARPPLQPDSTGTNVKSNAAIKNPLIVERKGARIIWKLQADQALQLEDGNMHLIHPTLTLFDKSDRPTRIQSQEAWFDPVARDVRFRGQAVAEYQQWQIRTEEMRYSSRKDEIWIPADFSVQHPTLAARGKNLLIQRQSQKLRVEQGIRLVMQKTLLEKRK